jgi:hypothetical protein
MLTFPILKTGAVAQYPLQRAQSFSNEVLRFIGGDEQRYRTSPGALRAWTIQLDLLDEDESSRLESFFVAAIGPSTVFDFSDPASGTVYPNCFINSDDLIQFFQGEMQAGTTLVIRQGRT